MAKIRGVAESMKELKHGISVRVDKVRASKMVSLLEKLKNATPVDTGNARDHWKIKGHDLINDVPYIEQLNAGSSQQAPARFIEATLLSDPQVKPAGIIVKHAQENIK